mgnify:CR=1 FL=1
MSEECLVGTSSITRAGNAVVVSASIHLANEEFNVWYRVEEGIISEHDDAFLAAALIPAMKNAKSLKLIGQVSRSLKNNSTTIQNIVHKWFPDFKKIPVTSGDFTGTTSNSQERGVGCFFSAGVDSFYTLLKHREEITHLIYVHGFDIWLHEEDFRSSVLREVRKVAKAFGKPLIFVETNIHEFSDHFADWGLHYHGAALASVALLLAPQFRTIYVPSSYAYDELFPWGSHPLLDPLWSTESLQIVHDGNEAGRIEKVALIAQSDIALNALRVCLDRTDGAYNCGHCEKCIRTMINLRLTGVPIHSTTFGRELDLVAVANLKLEDEHALIFAKENLRHAEAIDDQELAKALQQAIDRFEQRFLAVRLKNELPSLSQSQYWETLKNPLLLAIPSGYRKWFLWELVKEQLKDWDRNTMKGRTRKAWATLTRGAGTASFTQQASHPNKASSKASQ